MMIIVNGGGAGWGLPDISPYVMKTEVHLRMAGIAYEKRAVNPDEGPKGQLPFINDGGRLIGDSTFIRLHLEREYGVDFDAGLSQSERAQAFAVEMICEHELVQVLAYFRWIDDANFARGPATFMDGAPEAMRAQLKQELQDEVRLALRARGVARHTREEVLSLGLRSLKALELLLGERAFVAGDEPKGADAFVFAALAGVMTPFFSSPVRDAAIRSRTLTAYVARMMDRFFPEFEWDAGADAETLEAA